MYYFKSLNKQHAASTSLNPLPDVAATSAHGDAMVKFMTHDQRRAAGAIVPDVPGVSDVPAGLDVPDALNAPSAPGHGPDNGIVMITDGGPLSWITVNGVVAQFGPVDLIVEPGEQKSVFMKRRVRMLGLATVLGQLSFAVLQKFIKQRSKSRRREIIRRYDLNTATNPSVPVHKVGSVNSAACRARLKALNPKVVFVHGTRIIKGRTLKAVSAPFINIHAGINPAYRGQHGAYWARANGDDEHAGVTIHMIDEGVDTGQVLYQKKINAKHGDNITTYQFLQTATALPLVNKAIEDALNGALKPQTVALPSKQWFHPTLWSYLYAGLVRRVW